VKGIGRKAGIVMRATLHPLAPEHLLWALAPPLSEQCAPRRRGQCP